MKNILVIDDEIDICNNIKAILTDECFNIQIIQMMLLTI